MNDILIEKNEEIKKLLRDQEKFNSETRTFSDFESGLKFENLLYNSQFYIPLIASKQKTGGKMLYVLNEAKTKFYLIFTDFKEINNCFKTEKYNYLETTLDKVSKIALKNNALIILNWKSDNYILTTEMLRSLFSKTTIKPVNQINRIKHYSQAENLYPEFIQDLSTYLSSIDDVNKSYFLKDKNGTYLLLVETDKENLLPIKEAVEELLKDNKININLLLSTRTKPYADYIEFYNKDMVVTSELHA